MQQYNSYNQDIKKISVSEKDVEILDNGIIRVPTSENAQIAILSNMVYVGISVETINDIDSAFYEFTPTTPELSVAATSQKEVREPRQQHSESTLLIDQSMTRDVIVKLRIDLGEGERESEFSMSFPFEKI